MRERKGLVLLCAGILLILYHVSAVAALSLEDFAGTWEGQTEFEMGGDSTIDIEIGEDGSVIGGQWVGHPFQVKGKVTITNAQSNSGFTINFYFADICQSSEKVIENATFVHSSDGKHEIEGHVRNTCFPASDGWIRLKCTGSSDHGPGDDNGGGGGIGPEPPTGLALLVGVGWVDLEWNASTELDLAESDGYRLYRRKLLVLAEGAEAPVLKFPGSYNLIATGMGTWFHDMTVQSGAMYAYVLSVKDEDGNESGPSEEVYTTIEVYGPGEGAGGGGCFLSMAR